MEPDEADLVDGSLEEQNEALRKEVEDLKDLLHQTALMGQRLLEENERLRKHGDEDSVGQDGVASDSDGSSGSNDSRVVLPQGTLANLISRTTTTAQKAATLSALKIHVHKVATVRSTPSIRSVVSSASVSEKVQRRKRRISTMALQPGNRDELARSHTVELERQNEELLDTNRQLLKQVNDVKVLNADLEKQLASLNEVKAHVDNELQELRRIRNESASALVGADDDATPPPSHRGLSNGVGAFRDCVTRATRAKNFQDATEARAEIDRLHDKIAELRDQNQQISAQLAPINEAAVAAAKAKEKELMAALDGATADCQNYQAALSELMQKHDVMEEQNKQLQLTVEEMRAEVETLHMSGPMTTRSPRKKVTFGVSALKAIQVSSDDSTEEVMGTQGDFGLQEAASLLTALGKQVCRLRSIFESSGASQASLDAPADVAGVNLMLTSLLERLTWVVSEASQWAEATQRAAAGRVEDLQQRLQLSEAENVELKRRLPEEAPASCMARVRSVGVAAMAAGRTPAEVVEAVVEVARSMTETPSQEVANVVGDIVAKAAQAVSMCPEDAGEMAADAFRRLQYPPAVVSRAAATVAAKVARRAYLANGLMAEDWAELGTLVAVVTRRTGGSVSDAAMAAGEAVCEAALHKSASDSDKRGRVERSVRLAVEAAHAAGGSPDDLADVAGHALGIAVKVVEMNPLVAGQIAAAAINSVDGSPAVAARAAGKAAALVCSANQACLTEVVSMAAAAAKAVRGSTADAALAAGAAAWQESINAGKSRTEITKAAVKAAQTVGAQLHDLELVACKAAAAAELALERAPSDSAQVVGELVEDDLDIVAIVGEVVAENEQEATPNLVLTRALVELFSELDDTHGKVRTTHSIGGSDDRQQDAQMWCERIDRLKAKLKREREESRVMAAKQSKSLTKAKLEKHEMGLRLAAVKMELRHAQGRVLDVKRELELRVQSLETDNRALLADKVRCEPSLGKKTPDTADEYLFLAKRLTYLERQVAVSSQAEPAPQTSVMDWLFQSVNCYTRPPATTVASHESGR